MDKKIKLLAMMLLIMLGTSCCKEDDPIPTPELKLSKAELTLEVGQSEKIHISGGDGQNYSISPSNSEIAEAVIKGNFLEITARKVGIQNFTVNSAGKTAILKLTVKAQPIPHLGNTVGIYNLEGKALLVYTMIVRLKNGLLLCKSGANPYEQILLLPYYREGEQKILIKAEGFPSVLINTPPEGREFSIIKEKDLDDRKVQVRSGNFRFVLERQKGTSAST